MAVLRPLELSDLVALNGWRNNRALTMQTHGFRFPISLEMDREWYRRTILEAAPAMAVFAIQDETGAAVGLAQLNGIDLVHRHAELGLYLGESRVRGQGLGTAAVGELCAFGFDDLNLRRIFLQVTVGNEPAIRSYRAQGFTEEGVLREHYFADGRWHDVMMMGLLRQGS